MRSITAHPYLRPLPSLITVSGWMNPDGSPAFPEDMVRDWDPETTLDVHRFCSLDTAAIVSGCQLGRGAKLRLCIIWRSQGTGLQDMSGASGGRLDFLAGTELGQRQMRALVPGESLAGEVTLETCLVLLDPGEDHGSLAPTLPGSLLWKERTDIIVEGSGARFPVEATRFPSSKSSAAWSLEVSAILDQPFLGGVRLYLNSENPAIQKMLSGSMSAEASRLLWAAIYQDAGRQLVRAAVVNEEFLSIVVSATPGSAPFAEGTVGHALWSNLTVFFDGFPPRDLFRLMESRPAEFDTLVQHRFAVFREGD